MENNSTNWSSISICEIEVALARQLHEAPEPLRSYIRELQAPTDIAATIRELVYARVEREALARAIAELKNGIRKHRDARESKQRSSDLELYGLLD